MQHHPSDELDITHIPTAELLARIEEMRSQNRANSWPFSEELKRRNRTDHARFMRELNEWLAAWKDPPN